jgi:hypothetical protein
VKVLLDECVDRRLAREIQGHAVETVTGLGWAAAKNGELLVRAEGRFDAFVTVDRNLAFQQATHRFSFAVVILHARSNRLADLRPLVPRLLEVLPAAQGGKVTWIGTPALTDDIVRDTLDKTRR